MLNIFEHEPEMVSQLSGVHTELGEARIVLEAAALSLFQMCEQRVSNPN